VLLVRWAQEETKLALTFLFCAGKLGFPLTGKRGRFPIDRYADLWVQRGTSLATFKELPEREEEIIFPLKVGHFYFGHKKLFSLQL